MTVTPLTNEQLVQLMAQEPDLLLLDVRTPQEYWGLGHIPGARLLPMHEIPEQMLTLSPEQKTVVICEHGVRSANASHYLAHNGFSALWNLTAGMAEWNGPRVFTSEEADSAPQ
ncbi:rhodanese-like domain-containing protein [Vampirovibrio sp.]|uniref:rhodanese-like domain-containing protein n=1 Tax=Vampirovibrio sp. TaxID=2717857 RepID=UPI0035946700